MDSPSLQSGPAAYLESLMRAGQQLPEEHIVPAGCPSARELIALAVTISLRL